MSNLLRTNLIILCLIVLVGCHKDTHQVSNCTTCQDEACHNYVWPGNITFETYVRTGPQYTKPFFNPNNQDEFIYVKQIPGFPTNQLIKHVISSGAETILCSSFFIIGQPQWGKSGWIFFSKGIGQNNIVKIYQDGSSLQQITPNGYSCTHLILSHDGSEMLVNSDSYTSYTTTFYLPILNADGTLIDSLKTYFGNIQIGYPAAVGNKIKDGYYAYYNMDSNKYGYCRLNNGETIDLLFNLETTYANGLPIGVCKNSSQLFQINGANGLYANNLVSGSSKMLVQLCQSRRIESVSMSPDGQHILYEQVKGVQVDIPNQIIDEQSEIYTINVFTREKIKIIGD